jgi:GNAT superfamily N-acetyltransferase
LTRGRDAVTAISVERLRGAPHDVLNALIVDSERDGVRFVRRLVDEWTTGANRFDRPGEVLFVACDAGQVLGVGGLNVDPYAKSSDAERVGRVRHLYVLASHRRRGIASRLLSEVVGHARGRFDRLHLRTRDARAAALYGRFGFRSQHGDPHCTHVLDLQA